MKQWEITLNRLVGETTILPELLIEDKTLVKMIRENKPYPELLAYVNEHF